MRGLLAVSSAIDATSSFLGKWVSWLILLAILVSAINAVVRKIFSTSSNAWLELQWYLYGAAFLIAAAQVLRRNEHIRIDIIYGLFSRARQHWIDLLGHIFFLMPFVILMDIFLVPYVASSIRSQELSNNAGGLLLWPAKSLLLVGFVLLTFQGISEIIKKIAIIRGLIEDPFPFVPAHAAAEMEAAALVKEIGQ